MVCVSINVDWIPYVVGALGALDADSTWDTSDENTLFTIRQNVHDLMQLFAAMEACPVPIQFQPKPGEPVNWQYSLDGGATWLDGPNTAVHYTPVFTADGAAPSGYDETVNGGLSSAQVPSMIGSDPNAVVVNPGSLLRNEITAAAGVDGLVIQALAQVGVRLQNNGVAAFFQKIPGLGLAADAVEIIAGGGSYTYDLLQLSLP